MSKSAKEMFEELGYKQVANGKENIFYKSGFKFGILFCKWSKEVLIGNPNEIIDDELEVGELHSCTVVEHLAIHQQMIELGWLE